VISGFEFAAKALSAHDCTHIVGMASDAYRSRYAAFNQQYLSMKTVEESKRRQSANNRDDIENDPLLDRHDVEERIWEFPIDCRSVFDPSRVNQSE
jgi:hypothetical protein